MRIGPYLTHFGPALQEVGTTTDMTIDVEEVVLVARVTDIGAAVVLRRLGGIVMTSGDVAGTTIATLLATVDVIVMCVDIGNLAQRA